MTTTNLTTTAPIKNIVYDRETRDYRAELDGELVGYYRTYGEAEIKLDEAAYGQARYNIYQAA